MVVAALPLASKPTRDLESRRAAARRLDKMDSSSSQMCTDRTWTHHPCCWTRSSDRPVVCAQRSGVQLQQIKRRSPRPPPRPCHHRARRRMIRGTCSPCPSSCSPWTAAMIWKLRMRRRQSRPWTTAAAQEASQPSQRSGRTRSTS